MSTWFPDVQHSWLENLVIKILRYGVTPQHIAFIMDGNRRYATRMNEAKTQGHAHGFEKLTQTLSWCRDLGITQITLYTFSIENFKRPREEIDFLMELFRKQAQKVLEEFSKIEEHEICIRVYGKINLLPMDVQQALARMVLETAKFNKFYLNICFAYTAREEITTAMSDLSECLAKHIIERSDINYHTISNALYSQGLRDPDILIRTSGEIRLSDFLLWQSSFSSINFLDALWPEFNIWYLFAAILHYQYEYGSVKKVRENYFNLLKEEDLKHCRQIFMQTHAAKPKQLNGEKRKTIMIFHNNDEVEESFEHFLAKRNSRIEQCFQYIQNKRKEHLLNIVGRNLGGDEIETSKITMKIVDNSDCSNHMSIAEHISTTNNVSKSC